MSDNLSAYRLVDPPSVDLEKFDPAAQPASQGSKDADEKRLKDRVRAIGELQNRLFAEARQALLVLFQGMDTSGKDGAIAAVFAAVHPLGILPSAFKAPSPQELAHDYLWRVHARCPAKGEIGIFNRSHYEDVLAARVLGVADDAECRRRYAHLNDFERLLAESGTRVLKFFLHISKAEQKVRLQQRLDDPAKHWKFSHSDVIERGRWDKNMEAYRLALEHTATATAPWWLVPSDSKLARNLMVAEVVYRTLTDMAPAYPPLAPELANLKIQ